MVKVIKVNNFITLISMNNNNYHLNMFYANKFIENYFKNNNINFVINYYERFYYIHYLLMVKQFKIN